MGRILICWIDEAEPVTEEAFTTLMRHCVKRPKARTLGMLNYG